MFSQSVVAHAEIPLNERVEDRSTVPVENGAAVTIEELRTHHCRWPLGALHAKPPFLYCGERALAGKPYCDEHCARAFQARREVSAPGIRVSAFSHSESDEHAANRRRFLATLINADPLVQSVPPPQSGRRSAWTREA
jgi:hypothetical protein